MKNFFKTRLALIVLSMITSGSYVIADGEFASDLTAKNKQLLKSVEKQAAKETRAMRLEKLSKPFKEGKETLSKGVSAAGKKLSEAGQSIKSGLSRLFK